MVGVSSVLLHICVAQGLRLVRPLRPAHRERNLLLVLFGELVRVAGEGLFDGQAAIGVIEYDFTRITRSLTCYFSNNLRIYIAVNKKIIFIRHFVCCCHLLIGRVCSDSFSCDLYLEDIPGAVGNSACYRIRVFRQQIPMRCFCRIYDLVKGDHTFHILLCLDIIPCSVFELIQFERVDLILCRLLAPNCLVYNNTGFRWDQVTPTVRPHVAFCLTTGHDCIRQQRAVILLVHCQESPGGNDVPILSGRVS